jgi:hypothetical protein
MKSVSLHNIKYEIYHTQKNKRINSFYQDYHMSAIENKQISKQEMKIILKIYIQFDALESQLQKYHAEESLFYILLARKCFKEVLEKNRNLL